MRSTVIVSYARTAFGKFLGSIKDIPAVDLGALVVKEALKRGGVSKGDVDYLFMGMVLQAGAGQIPSRQVSIKAGLPVEVPSDTINKVCASSLRAVNLADSLIRNGDAEVVVAGGMENMSLAPYILPSSRSGMRMGNSAVVDAMVHDGLWCPFDDVHMGVHGGVVADEFGITREEQDEWAYRSQDLAIQAQDKGRFDCEIVPVEIPRRKGNNIIFDKDELLRRDASLEVLAKLKPAFQKEGSVTAGNAPPISDGASAIVLMEKEKALKMGIKPLAEIVSQGWASASPPYIATVPAIAGNKALEKAGLQTSDLDLIEVNEAFAAVALTSIKLGKWQRERVNVNGGAIALGHPIGASGGRILLTLVEEMINRKAKYGLATICSGAAQGEATIVKLADY